MCYDPKSLAKGQHETQRIGDATYLANRKRSSSMHEKRTIVVHALSVTGSAFVLHYLWENMQCPLFFIHTGGHGGQPPMIIATLAGVAMTWIAQGLVAAVSKRWLWLPTD
jgi:hypothetical protein